MRQDAENPGPALAGHAQAEAASIAATLDADGGDHERFIPVTRPALRDRLFRARGWQGEEERRWRKALHCLAAWRHQIYREKLQTLLECYLPFSPDRDTERLLDLTPEAMAQSGARLLAGIEDLLVRANYIRISEPDLERFLRERTPYGLHLEVDLSEYELMLLYYRGSEVETREQRDPWRAYLAKLRFSLPVFKRLFLLVKLKSEEVRLTEIMASDGVDRERARKILRRRRSHLPPKVSSDHVYLKLFKHIPQIDLEMLFPNTKVAFRPLDKLQLGVTAGGGTVAGVVGTATKLMAATSPLALAGAIVGLSGLIFRQVTKFFHTRNRYMMTLAQNLYFHNLANNRGALTLLADRAEEEDVKEDMLLYVFLADRATARAELPAVKRQIEDFLRETCGIHVAFDVEDALSRLRADGIVTEAPDGALTALLPQEAGRHLDTLWDRLLDEDMLDARLAQANR